MRSNLVLSRSIRIPLLPEGLHHMALKRLDEEFELKPGTQLLPYMKRLLPSLEGRFQSVELTAKQYSELIDYIRAAAVLRMNEILIPATEDIIAVTKLGFLLAPSSTLVELSLGPHYFFVDEGPQRDTFTPSPYLILERKDNIDDYAIARLIQYQQSTGQLDVDITAWHGNAGPWSDWVISSTPGMADSTKIYHDAVGPMHEEVVADTEQVRIMRDEILAAAERLEAAGIDTYNYVRRDGSIPFIAPQQGVPPPVGSNDTNFATTAWTRSRIIEYTATSVTRTGDTMSGPLSLSGLPSQPAHAASKAYVDFDHRRWRRHQQLGDAARGQPVSTAAIYRHPSDSHDRGDKRSRGCALAGGDRGCDGRKRQQRRIKLGAKSLQ